VEDKLIWEYEPNATLIEPTALPKVADEPPMSAEDFDALQRSARWTALSPFLNPDRANSTLSKPFASPFFGAVQVEDFQLLPLTKALQMPRISLLLADDVGLGKTIEAGLILVELLLRRRIRRVLILCPAALRKQWQQEMKSKFSINFDVVDRAETHALQKRLGLDANPWRTFPRIITSYHYLRQPDVLEQFRSACAQPEGVAQLPWDLLIVDEAHNLMPSNFGRDSDLAEMLRFISPWFEHKLFLTATPHNGHTRCFTGLLEQLDPVRFTQTNEITDALKERIQQVVVRRLKREINHKDDREGQTSRFGDRSLEPVPLYFSASEKQLSRTFSDFRSAVKSLIASAKKTEQLAGSFAIEVLNKRLLSCPYTFAQSWLRFQEGIKQQETAIASEVQAAKRSVLEDLDDDRETEGRIQYAAKTTGAWLKPLIPRLTAEIEAVDRTLAQLGLSDIKAELLPNPSEDERWQRLLKLIKQYLQIGKEWITDERLIIFTEYKTTLDYLERRLQETFSKDEGRIRVLFGGMSDQDREEIKQAFNDPNDPIRILVATDAASEGLNLQETARLVFHWDIPWNPARLEQRNGRLDRHGQAQDVIVFHFTSEDNADLQFLGRVVEKANAIREDLGSMEEIFDAAFARRFEDLEDSDRILENLERSIKQQQGRTVIPRQEIEAVSNSDLLEIEQFKQEIDLSPETLRSTLEIALGMGVSKQNLEGPDEQGRLRLHLPLPPKWEPLIDDYLRLESKTGTKGALPAIVFDPQHFIHNINNRPIFRSAKDTVLLHLGHPIFHFSLAMFARARFPGGDETTTRWIVRYGEVPNNADALMLLTVEELALNELREPFHHWVRTVRFAIKDEELGEALYHLSAEDDRPNSSAIDENSIAIARDLWDAIERDVRQQLGQMREDLTQQLQAQLQERQKEAQKEEKERFKSRIQEVQRAMKETSLSRLEKEREKLLDQMLQFSLFPEEKRSQEEKLRDLDDELKRRQNHYQELLQFLQQEQKRVIESIIPRRYSMPSSAQVFPVTVEIRLPEVVR
jgi:superfamily II DNA or RNA helicase